MNLDFSKCPLVPVIQKDGTIQMSGVKDHVKIGVEKFIQQPFFLNADEMGMMKGAQVIIASQFLAEDNEINRVVIVCPQSVRRVWFEPELGELRKHLWLPSLVTEYHSRNRQWGTKDGLRWVITNYDYIRGKENWWHLAKYCDGKTLLVLDESSAVKNDRSQQSEACLALRKKCGRVILLNGTPIPNSPADVYSQARIMDGGKGKYGILEASSFFQFRARYGVLKTVQLPDRKAFKQVTDWKNLDDLMNRMAPYVIRRLKKDHLKDLPEKLPTVILEAQLTPKTWKHYVSMRDDLIAWLSQERASLAPHAITKIMRLAQITSGFIGGVEEILGEDGPREEKTVEEIGREKLDVYLDWMEERLHEEPDIKMLTWCRFRPEALRLIKELRQRGGIEVGAIIGGQKAVERENSIRLLDPRTMPPGPVGVVGTLGTGGKGLTLVGSHTVFRMSLDYSPEKVWQADDRVHRSGQMFPVSYTGIVAVGPKGQKTIDHGIALRLEQKQETAMGITSGWESDPREWVSILSGE